VNVSIIALRLQLYLTALSIFRCYADVEEYKYCAISLEWHASGQLVVAPWKSDK